jgi:hypothetical protein
LLTDLQNSISANGLLAWLPWGRTHGAWLDPARARTAVTTVGVSVVAGLTSNDATITAKGSAHLPWYATTPAGLYRLAVAGAAVARDRVAVVAALGGRHTAVATAGNDPAKRRLAGAGVGVFKLAPAAAAIAGKGVAVVALFAQIKMAISTFRHWDCESRDGSTSAARGWGGATGGGAAVVRIARAAAQTQVARLAAGIGHWLLVTAVGGVLSHEKTVGLAGKPCDKQPCEQ